MILIILIALVILGGSGMSFWKYLGYRETKALRPAPEVNLLDKHYDDYDYRGCTYRNKGSKAGWSVAKLYNDIPKGCEPFGPNELYRMLHALDLKWGDRAWQHNFNIRFFEEVKYNDWYWNCGCVSKWYVAQDANKKCLLWDDYGRLAWEFKMITVAADEQERAFKLEGMVEQNPEHLNMLLDRARAESDIINKVTKELTSNPTVDEAEAVGRIATLRQKAETIRAELTKR